MEKIKMQLTKGLCRLKNKAKIPQNGTFADLERVFTH